MTKRTVSVVAWTLTSAAVLLSAVGFYYVVLSIHTPLPSQYFGPRGNSAFLSLAFAGLGLILATKRPSNPIGWIALSGAALAGLQTLADGYAIWAVSAHGSEAVIARIAAVGEDYIWMPPFAMVGVVFTIFPNGRPLSRGWGRAMWVCIAGTAVTVVGYALSRNPLIFRGVDNPFAVPGAYQVGNVATMSFFALLILGMASLVARLRRSSGDEREQTKWLAYSAGLVVVGFFFYFVAYALAGGDAGAPIPNVLEIVILLAIVSIPVTIGIGILKYRLYDIDVVINKTLVYGILAALITVLYVGIVVGFGTLVGATGSGVLSAVAAAIVAIAFQPVRNRVQHFANRMVYGKRATPYEVLSQLSDQLAEVYSLEEILPRTARLIVEGTGAERAEIWLRDGSQLRPASAWPQRDTTPAPLTISGDADLPEGERERMFPVRHQGELIGAVGVATPASEPLTEPQVQLIQDLAAQAGLVLRNVGLIEQLRSSRQRLVAAQDEERRRLERDLHDGAQQQLVALAVKVRLLEGFVSKDPAQAAALASQLNDDLASALEDLRTLARGIFPPLLADKGLAAALDAQGRKAAIPVDVQQDGIGRYPQQTEAAVYFCCLEALQNVAKYANATKATISLSHENDVLTFTVSDDGQGFDTGATAHGAGMQNMTDRLDALGGSIDLRSRPGGGTEVTGRVPAKTLEEAK